MGKPTTTGQQARNLHVLGKRVTPPFSDDSDVPGINGLDGVLVALACYDFRLYRDEGGADSSASLIEAVGPQFISKGVAGGFLGKLIEEEVIQAASNSRIIPDMGFGGSGVLLLLAGGTPRAAPTDWPRQKHTTGNRTSSGGMDAYRYAAELDKNQSQLLQNVMILDNGRAVTTSGRRPVGQQPHHVQQCQSFGASSGLGLSGHSGGWPAASAASSGRRWQTVCVERFAVVSGIGLFSLFGFCADGNCSGRGPAAHQ